MGPVMSRTARRQYDLVVIGADLAGLAAAACAARQGADIEARVLIIRTGDEPTSAGSTPCVPDFVWRRLNLHESAFAARPVDALVTLLSDGRSVTTIQNRRRSGAALTEADHDPLGVWPEVMREWDGVWKSAYGVMLQATKSGARILDHLRSDEGAMLAEQLCAPLETVLDDCFEDDSLKTHLAASALMPFGLAGDEPGSALALSALSDQAWWRWRAGGKGAALVDALEAACAAAGVDAIESDVVSVERQDGKDRRVVLADGTTIRAKAVMTANAHLPVATRLNAAPALSPLSRREGASAEIRVKLARPAQPPGDHKHAVYFLAGSIECLKAARDAALEGRVHEEPPLYFEINRDEIIVRAPYCPAALYADNEPREWGEQDRQMLGRIVVERLGSALNGAVKNVRRVDVKISARGLDPTPRAENVGVIAPPTSHDEIGAAARLAMELVLGE